MAKKGWKKKESLRIHLEIMGQRIGNSALWCSGSISLLKAKGTHINDGTEVSFENIDTCINNLHQEAIQLHRMAEELAQKQLEWEDARE